MPLISISAAASMSLPPPKAVKRTAAASKEAIFSVSFNMLFLYRWFDVPSVLGLHNLSRNYFTRVTIGFN